MILSLVLASCGKEIEKPNDDSVVKNSPQDDAIIKKIQNFTAAMTGTPSVDSRSSGGESQTEYTPEEFLKNTEESINLKYSKPFKLYVNTELKKDSLLINLENCKIKNAPEIYNLILNKLKCQFYCSNLSNKSLKFVKLSALSLNCSQLKVLIKSSIGDTGGSALPQLVRKNHTQDLWGTRGLCTTPGVPFLLQAAEEVCDYATYNINFNNLLPYGSIIDIEEIPLRSNVTPNLDWWSFKCYYHTSEKHCNGIYDLDNGGNQLYRDENCVTAPELNNYTVHTEQFCLNVAAQKSKKFLEVIGWSDSGTSGYENRFWAGYLTIGKYVISPFPEETMFTNGNGCGCN